VADIKWNVEVQMDALRNGLSNELKASLQYADMPDNIVDFVKMYSKCDSQIRARAAEKMSGRWEGGYKQPDNANNTTSAPEASPAGTVAGDHGPAHMDLSVLKGRKITPQDRKHRTAGGLFMYCGNSRHFVASCPRKLKAASGQVEINPFKEDLGKEKDNEVQEKEKEVESGKV
jgi:hypothetical protein